MRSTATLESPSSEPLFLNEDALFLLRFTDRFDDDPVTSLWISVSNARDAESREQSLMRWLGWATQGDPPFATLQQFSAAIDCVLHVLEGLALTPERTAAAPPDVLPALARALRAWTRAREADADAERVIGGVRATLEAVAKGAPAPSAAERNILASTLRRLLERSPAAQSADALQILTALDPTAPVLAPFAESMMDLLLLDGDLRGEFDPALAECATMPWWPNALRLGIESVGRGAMRSARLLSALSAHPYVVDALGPATQRAIREVFPKAIAHSRFAVWSRAARAAGRLAGVLPGIGPMLDVMLEPSSPATIRRRAHAALGSLSPLASESLLQRKANIEHEQPEAWQLAALSIALPDACDAHDDRWMDRAQTLAAQGGPETWTQLALALREISARSENLAHAASAITESLKTQINQHRPASPAETESADRAHAIIHRVWEQDGEATPWQLLVVAARKAADTPSHPAIAGAVEEFIAHTEQSVASALRAVGLDYARAAARAGVVLEELLDLVIDGDMTVVAERISDAAARQSALDYAEALRSKLLRTTWTGLRRPTPMTTTWRRWLLRSAAVLSRVESSAISLNERERVTRSQVLETLERVADDPAMRSASLQRYVVATIVELADSLRPRLGDTSALIVVAWMALRTGETPAHNRVRRSFEGVSQEAIDKLYFALDKLAKNKRATPKDLLDLAESATPRTRMGVALTALAGALTDLDGRKAEQHWSGLPKLDLDPIAKLADELARCREHAIEGLTIDESAPNSSGETLGDRAARLNRALTSTSLKFVDSARRAEIVEQYVSDLSLLSEAIATACGPIAGPVVRATLARALVLIRTQASQIADESGEGVRFIGRLKVLGPLGSAAEGGMAATWLAEGPAPGKRVVVKLLPWDRYTGGDAETTRKLFEGEMARLASLVHPNVVSIVDAGFVDEGAYIAVELIPGASLETILREVGAIDLRFLQLILRDAARGLAHMHAHGMVHRDVKPGNIMVQLDGLNGPLTAESLGRAQFVRAVVIDLGISTDIDQELDDNEEGLVGTPGYLAPEIARGFPSVSAALDVYALGVVAFEALTGENPFLEGDPELMTILVRHGTMHMPIERLSSALRERTAMISLLQEMTSLAPEKRPTMRDFLTRWVSAVRG